MMMEPYMNTSLTLWIYLNDERKIVIMVFVRDNENTVKISEKKKMLAARKLTFSLDEIDKMLTAWQIEEKLFFPENVINTLFCDGKKRFSKSRETEFFKVCIVNQIYGTNLYTEDIIQIAKYLSENAHKLNEELYDGNVKVISDITCSIKNTRGKYCYSFATKYCSFAAPDEMIDMFPIYDSYMSAFYKIRTDKWNPNNEKGFCRYYFDSWEGNPNHDEYRYEMYRKAVKMMQKEISTEKKLNIKQLDQYIWKAMKTYSET